MSDNGKDARQSFTARFSARGMADLHLKSEGNPTAAQMLALSARLEREAEVIEARALASGRADSELSVLFASLGSSEFVVNVDNVTANQILILARWLDWQARLLLNMVEAARQQGMARNAALAQKIIRAPKH